VGGGGGALACIEEAAQAGREGFTRTAKRTRLAAAAEPSPAAGMRRKPDTADPLAPQKRRRDVSP
jgi:hypothetical protein